MRKATYWKVHTPNLLKELVENNPTLHASAARPLDILGKMLFVLGEIAKDLNNEELNSLMCRMTLFDQADMTSKGYDKRTSKLIHKYDAKFIDRLHGKKQG